MAEREVTWEWSGGYTRLGDDRDTVVPEWAVVDGRGLRGAPNLRARFEVHDGVPECVEFSLVAQENGRAIRSADLRLFDIDAFTFNTFMRAAKYRPAEAAQAGPDAAWWQMSRDLAHAQRGRIAANRAELEEVARIYRENIDATPTKAVAVGMGYSGRTAARRVGQAREAGLLPPTTKGRRRAD